MHCEGMDDPLFALEIDYITAVFPDLMDVKILFLLCRLVKL